MSAGLDAKELRQALGRFATGIAIITADEGGHPRGMTANSLAAVSLSPPLLLICIANNARIAKVLEASDRYGLSVLAHAQEPISRHFSGRANPWLEITFTSHNGVPLIGGALAHFVCRIVAAPFSGDHRLYIGEVEYFRCDDGEPLVFFAGGYGHRLGDAFCDQDSLQRRRSDEVPRL